MRTMVVQAVALSLAALVVGCTGDSDEGAASGVPPATGCAADTRKDAYVAGLTKSAGSLSVRLVESRPGPPIKGKNAMTIEVLDAGGQPVDGAIVIVTPWMPDHAHGSAAKPIVTPAGRGKYDVENVYLAMAGLWQIKITVQLSNGGALEEATFQFCLDG